MNFYQQLQSFEDFSGITDDSHFAEIPKDWWVVVGDIKDSTQAVEAGRYKDVNTLGAAVIAVAHNQLGEGTFPFVFGGDGATLVIPPESISIIKSQLVALRALAWEKFEMTLRVGALQISELEKGRVEVAKHHLAGQKSLAVFRGGGLTEVEDRIKTDDGEVDFPEAEDAQANLTGLSCRWQPIQAKRGYSLSLLVKSLSGGETYDHVLSEISKACGGELDHANPVNIEGTRYRTVRQCLADERRYHDRLWSLKFAWRAFEIVAAVLIFGHGVPGPFHKRKYIDSLSRHSDYRKFDDMLRMIIDCTEEQVNQIRAMLEKLREEKKVAYGIHLAEESLMTCFFHGPDEGEHIHFIDGGNGGYAMAAKQLKAQLVDS